MPNKTAFVTGGTVFIGLNLVEHLTQSGWDVVALHRPKSRLMYLQKYPVRLVEGAIEDAASLVGCGLSESRECNRPLRLGHVVTVHSPGGERAIAAHSAGTRLLRRCGSRCAGASCGSREGSHGHNYILGGSEASYAEIVQMVGKLLGQPTINTAVGRPPVLRGAGRISEWISMITGK